MPIVTQVNLLKKRRTKIVATLGPASDTPDKIRKLIEAGVNVFRLNMSHGDHDYHHRLHSHVRTVADELKLPIAILVDLCGPKIRTGKFKNGEIQLVPESHVVVTTRDVEGEPGVIPSQYAALADDVIPGNRILLNDGMIELRVESVSGTEISCKVIHGGPLKDHKGINLPGVTVSTPSLTLKDKQDARFALGLGIDFLALSFVRRASDIDELRKLIEAANQNVAIVAKIEKPEALKEADEIIDATDAIMVARSDLGVELTPEQVPVAQSQLIDRARAKFKPVIVATQMLESMIDSARPTRAEVTDISHAVSLGTDAVMLSAETAAGAHPVEAVKMMDRIARQTESYLWQTGSYGTPVTRHAMRPFPVWEVIGNATSHISKDLQAHAVLVISQSGITAATMSSARPAAPVVGITQRPEICRRMALLWSVIPVLTEAAGKTNPNEVARHIARELGLAEEGQCVLLVRGFHSDPLLNTPSITIITV